MMQIKRWIMPPIFPDDELRTRRADLLNSALFNIATLIPMILIGNVLGGKTPLLVCLGDALAIALCAILWLWMRQGKLWLASVGLLTMSFILVTASATTLGTIRTPTTAMYLLIIITGSLLFELPGMIITTAIASLLIGGLIGAENLGLLPRPDYSVTITQWVTYSAVGIWTGSLIFSALRIVRRTLVRAENEISERKRAEQVLSEQQKHSQSLLHLARDLERAQTYEQVRSAAHEQVQARIGYSNLWIFLLSEDKKYFQALVAGGTVSNAILSEHQVRRLTIQGDRMLEEIAAAKDIVLVQDARTDERTDKAMVAQMQNRTIINVPILLSDKHLGAIGMGTFGDEGVRVPTISELEFLRAMASHVAVALDRIRLLEQRDRVEQELRQSEDKYRRLFSELPNGCTLNEMIYDGEGHPIDYVTLEVNQSFEQLLKTSAVQVIGKKASEILPKEELKDWIEIFSIPALYGRSIRYKMYSPLNQKHFEGVAYSPQKGKFAVAFLDVTEREQAEEKLYAASLYARSLIEASLDPLVTINPDGKITDVNKATELATGVARANLIGDDFSNYFTEPDKARAGYQQVLARGFVRDYPLTMRHTSGKTIDVLYNATVYKNELDEIQGVFAAARDVTERKRIEDELRESESRYRSIFDNSIDGIMLTVPDGHILAANPEACRMFGRTEEQMRQTHRNDLVDPTDPRLSAALAERARTGKFLSELTCIRKDGTKFPGEISSVIFRDKAGNEKISMLIHDITERKQAEDALRESEHNYRTLANSGRALIWRAGIDTLCNYFNEIWLEFTGRTQDREMGNGWTEGVHPDDLARCLKIYQEAFERREPFSMEYRLRRRDGEYRWLQDDGCPQSNSAGEFVGYIGHCLDITERKHAEEEIRKSEAGLREAQRLGRLGSWDWDAITDTITWSTEYYHIYGLDPTQSPPGYVEHLKAYTPESAARLDAAVKRNMQTGEPYEVDLELAGTERPRRWITARSETKRDAQGRIIGLRGTAQDISERKWAEEEVARSLEAEKKARQVAEILREANESLSSALDLDHVLQNLLEYLSRLVAYDSANVMLCKNDFQVQVVAVRGYENWTDPTATRKLSFDLRTTAAINHIITTQKSSLIDDTREYPGWIRPAGAEHVINWIGVPIIAKGEIIGLYSVDKAEPNFFTQEHLRLVESLAGQAAVAIQNARLHDQVKRANAELEQRVTDRTAELEAANKELEAFAYSVSHDLRAPLRHIDAFLHLLEKRTENLLDEESQHYMSNISHAASRMGTLIDDLLAFSRMGRHEMSKLPVDLNSLVQQALQELGPEIKGRSIHWHIALLPTVTGDRAMLLAVLVNLISNALKFSRTRETAEIEIGLVPNRAYESIIFVRDNGVGFDMKYASKLFGVFQRLHRVEDFEGTGIGLANVRRIVNRHGGRTWAESQVDQGATFYFSLPQIYEKV
ncbi:MAG: PAS domain S-box protein [Chloroflexi bacterium]|nr:PAS domain S-box protein [Chloroflexota bacterium]